eukprot:756057-Hanusia_phi.AAC.1
MLADLLSIDDAVAALYPLDVHPSYLLYSCSSIPSPTPLPLSVSTSVHAASQPPPPCSSLPSPGSSSSPGSSPSDSSTSSPSEAQAARKMWAPDEHARFLQALQQHVTAQHGIGLRDTTTGRVRAGLGRGVARKIAQAVGTRSEAQVRSHAQKVFQQASRTGRSPWAD